MGTLFNQSFRSSCQSDFKVKMQLHYSKHFSFRGVAVSRCFLRMAQVSGFKCCSVLRTQYLPMPGQRSGTNKAAAESSTNAARQESNIPGANIELQGASPFLNVGMKRSASKVLRQFTPATHEGQIATTTAACNERMLQARS